MKVYLLENYFCIPFKAAVSIFRKKDTIVISVKPRIQLPRNFIFSFSPHPPCKFDFTTMERNIVTRKKKLLLSCRIEVLRKFMMLTGKTKVIFPW